MHLSPDGLVFWQTTSGALRELGLLGLVDLGILSICASLWDQYCEAERDRTANGSVQVNGNGVEVARPCVMASQRAIASLGKLLPELAATPKARSMLKMPTRPPRSSPAYSEFLPRPIFDP